MSFELHFLVVDDVHVTRRAVGVSLQSLGYSKISEAEHGKQALDFLRSAAASGAPVNFVVTDWNMPVMDGMALLKTIRECTDLKHLAVLMMSAQSGVADRMTAAQAGADGYLVKPLNAATLKATLDDILARKGWKARVP